jgi:hypothetical protein
MLVSKRLFLDVSSHVDLRCVIVRLSARGAYEVRVLWLHNGGSSGLAVGCMRCGISHDAIVVPM